MPDGDIFELSVDQTYSDQNIVNVHHFKQVGTDGTGLTNLEGLSAVYLVDIASLMLDMQVDTLSMVQIRCRRIQPTQTQQLVTAASDTGSIAFNGMPPNSCAIARFYGSLSGRKGIGFTKICGVPVNAVDEGRIDLAYSNLVTPWAAKFAEVLTDVGSGWSFEGCVYSRIDQVGRSILKGGPTGRVKTVYSRSAGVGI